MVNELISHTLTVHTVHFGQVTIPADAALNLTAPLPPFIGQTRFVILADPAETPFVWLQSLDEPALTLVLVPCEELANARPAQLTAAQRADLGLGPGEQPAIYAVVALGEGPGAATANLLAPLYVCHSARRARQIVGPGDLSLARTPLW